MSSVCVKRFSKFYVVVVVVVFVIYTRQKHTLLYLVSSYGLADITSEFYLLVIFIFKVYEEA